MNGRVSKVEGELQIGIDGHGQVVLNLDHDRTGHIIFSPRQARCLAYTLLKKAEEADEEVAAIEHLERMAEGKS